MLRKTIFYFSTPYSLISFSGRQRVDNSFTVCACIEMYFHLVWEGGEEDNNNRKKIAVIAEETEWLFTGLSVFTFHSLPSLYLLIYSVVLFFLSLLLGVHN